MPTGLLVSLSDGQRRLDRFLTHRHDLALMAPFMSYLLLMGMGDALISPEHHAELRWVAALLRGVGALLVLWAVRKHLPAWGTPLWHWAIPAGALAAFGWVVGQHVFDSLGIPQTLPGLGSGAVIDPRTRLGAAHLFWTIACLRITVAVTVVPLVEELFWRGFMLRALVNWHDFESVPLGQFAWRAFIGTALLSALQHPGNWLVSIFCWLFYNALFYWRKSILLLVLVHGITNLVLYLYVLEAEDWRFW
jgi:hypothetical protein